MRARAQARRARLLARVGLWLAAFALLSQSLAVAAHETRRGDAHSAARELSALLGPGVVVCARIDPGAPAPPPDRHAQCPLCRLAADPATLDPPEPPAIAAPARIDASRLTFPRKARRGADFAGFSLARGPPSPS